MRCHCQELLKYMIFSSVPVPWQKTKTVEISENAKSDLWKSIVMSEGLCVRIFGRPQNTVCDQHLNIAHGVRRSSVMDQRIPGAPK